MTGPEPAVPPQAITADRERAITAAALRLKEGHARFGIRLPANDRRALAAEVVEAAAPHLEAAVRERCAQLAEQYDAKGCLQCRDHPGHRGFHPVTSFAGLLREGGEGGGT